MPNGTITGVRATDHTAPDPQGRKPVDRQAPPASIHRGSGANARSLVKRKNPQPPGDLPLAHPIPAMQSPDIGPILPRNHRPIVAIAYLQMIVNTGI